MVFRMALAGVPESEWPEYEGSGEEHPEDAALTDGLRELYEIRRAAALVEPSTG